MFNRRKEMCEMLKWKKRILFIFKRRAEQLRVETYAIYLAYKDSRVPWYAKILIACIVGYVFSPIDPIPDFIPIIGYVDDLILVPLGIGLVIKMIPPDVLSDCRAKARSAMAPKICKHWVTASAVILVIWFLFASLGILFTARIIRDWNVVLNWWYKCFWQITQFIPFHY
jgi:uncharacterized membrane protein YkvA (DUF1232 family)